MNEPFRILLIVLMANINLQTNQMAE
jgi:hypothetical protein